MAETVGWIVVQTLRDMRWGPLDYLLIDLPPSAGQPQQGLLDNVQMDGVIIVTTPQDRPKHFWRLRAPYRKD
jgi:ATP-binding protein involved in chromosome partitioning